MAFELTDKEKTTICQNSIERVINNGIWVTDEVLIAAAENSDIHERADILNQDLKELKRIVCTLWDRERDKIFMESNGQV